MEVSDAPVSTQSEGVEGGSNRVVVVRMVIVILEIIIIHQQLHTLG